MHQFPPVRTFAKEHAVRDTSLVSVSPPATIPVPGILETTPGDAIVIAIDQA